MAFQQGNFNMQGQVPMASIVQAYQNKAMQEHQMKQQAEQAKRAKTQELLQTIGMASQLVQQGVSMSNARQLKENRALLASTMAAASDPFPTGQMKDSGQAGIGQVPIMGTRGQNDPAYKQELMAMLTQSNPQLMEAAVAKEGAKAMFAQPDAKLPEMATEKVVIKGVPTIVKKDKQGNYYYRNDQPVSADTKVEPYSSRDSMVVLSDADRANPTLQKQARAVIEGRAKLTSFASARSARGQKITALAMEINPEGDLSLFNERNAIRRDFVSGSRGKEAKALDTMILHSDKLLEAKDSMDSKIVKKYNTMANLIKSEAKGNPELRKTAMLARGTARETLRVLQGVGVVTQQEAMEMKEDLNPNASPEEFYGAVDGLLTLAGGRLMTLKSDWNHKMGEFEPPFPIMNDRSRKILERRGYDPDTMDKRAPSTSGASAGWNTSSSGVKWRVKK
jgi:hypothetical protein